MAAGCVPIIAAPLEDLAPNLPFRSSVDWANVALFSGGLSCSLLYHADDTIAWLRELLDEKNAAALGCLRKRARSAYRRHLSYRGQGVVTALLHELKNDPRHADFLGRVSAEPVRDPYILRSCHVEAQCGCTQDQSTLFVRYHKTGSTLTNRLMRDMQTVCGVEHLLLSQAMSRENDVNVTQESRHVEDIGASARIGDGCVNVAITLDENNLDSFTEERLVNLTKPKPHLQFVHMIREPLRLVASYYTSHMLGTERTEGVYEMLWANLTQLPMSDGLVHVAELVMARQLPMMVHLHQLFSSSVTRLPRTDVLELRLEDLATDYDTRTAGLAQHVGLPQGCVHKGSSISRAFVEHDVTRWTEEEKAADPTLTGTLAEGTLQNLLHPIEGFGFARALNLSQLGNGTVDFTDEGRAYAMLIKDLNASVLPRLLAFGRALGYTYPANPRDLLPPEAPPAPEPEVVAEKEASLVSTMEPGACERLLRKKPDLVVEPTSGLIWCPTSDAASASLFDALNARNSSLTSKQLTSEQRAAVCGRGATSFTIVRNPWERLLAIYMKRIVKYGDRWVDRYGDGLAKSRVMETYRESIAAHSGVNYDEYNVTFGQFVRWLSVQPAGAMSPHWMSTSVRCDPQHVPYSLTAHHETLESDVQTLFDALGWAYPRAPPRTRSTLDECASSWACTTTMKLQAGADWSMLDMDSLLERMFDLEPELPQLINGTYGGDGDPYGYQPWMVAGGSTRLYHGQNDRLPTAATPLYPPLALNESDVALHNASDPYAVNGSVR
jgi:hypothetical protein